MLDLYTIIGIFGMVLILAAFIMEDFGKFHRGGWEYNVCNLVGSILLIIYALYNNAIVFVILNIFWAVIAVYFLYRNR